MYELKSPLSVGFQITGKCNLKCAYCYAHKSNPIDMTLVNALRLSDELISLGTMSISIEGGEPLLHPNFEEITMRFLSAGLDVALLSNGTICNDRVIKSIINLSEKSEYFTFQVSLDSVNNKVNDITRGMGKLVLENLKKFSDFGIDTTIATVVHTYNLPYIFEMIERLKSYIHNFHFMHLMPISGHKYRIKGLEPDQNKLKNFWNRMLEYQSENTDLFISTPYNATNSEFGVGILKCNGCTGGITRATITPDLLFIPCGICPDIILGDLKHHSIEELWNGNKVKNVRKVNFPLCQLNNTELYHFTDYV